MNSLAHRSFELVSGRMTNARPHPGPLPQERENTLTLTTGSNGFPAPAWFVSRPKPETNAVKIADWSPSPRTLTLSRGERARVRASHFPESLFLGLALIIIASASLA